MAEIWFYHLENRPLMAILPGLLQRGLERGWKMVVEAGTPEAVAPLSEGLWAAEDVAFIPHGSGDEATSGQPIWLCADDANPHAAAYRFYVEGALPRDVSGLERAIILFDSNSETGLASAREEWKKRKAEGHAISYWKQDEAGRWQNLAS